jgi:hypothetical protein
MNARKHYFCTLLAMTAALVTLVAAGSSVASAHGNPEIVITPNPAAAGAAVEIEGEGFDEDVEVSLTLEGVSGDIALGMAVTDAEGTFQLEVTLPDAAAPASYRIRAEGGDASGLADFRISQGAGGSQAAAEHEASIGFHREASTGLVIGLAAVAAILAVAGLALLLVRERRTTTSEEAKTPTL